MREKDVLEYLRNSPHFFRRHSQELSRRLRLAERDVVDLTGKQLVALRDENTAIRAQLSSWYTNAADNEAILEFLHRLAVGLLKGNAKTGNAGKVLGKEMDGILEIELCKLCDLKAKNAPKLTERDQQRLENCDGVLRTSAPLKSLEKLVGKGQWQAFLYVPVVVKNKLRAVVICATETAREFPREADADYALRMADLLAAALGNES